MDRKRVGLLPDDAPVAYPVLVGGALTHSLDESLPYPGDASRVEAVGNRIPAVPITDHGNRVGVGGPHRELDSPLDLMGAEFLVEAVVGPLVPEMEVVLGEEAGWGRGRRHHVECIRIGPAAYGGLGPQAHHGV